MSDLKSGVSALLAKEIESTLQFVSELKEVIEEAGYSTEEVNDSKPWGAYIRLANSDSDAFVSEFFSGLSLEDARLGIKEAELSPKFLIVSPAQRLSWQYHYRRAERWTFLTNGAYYRSDSDNQGEKHTALAGEVVQFATAERHRLVAEKNNYTVVAEIWQHSDPLQASDEDDIVRLSDDYRR